MKRRYILISTTLLLTQMSQGQTYKDSLLKEANLNHSSAFLYAKTYQNEDIEKSKYFLNSIATKNSDFSLESLDILIDIAISQKNKDSIYHYFEKSKYISSKSGAILYSHYFGKKQEWYENKGNPSAVFRSLLTYSSNTELGFSPEAKTYVYRKLASYAYKCDKIDSAFLYAELAYNNLTDHDIFYKITTLKFIGHLSEKIDSDVRAYTCSSDALVLSESYCLTRETADILQVIGKLFLKRESYTMAIEALEGSINIYKSLDETNKLVPIYINLGIAHRNLDAYPEALTHYETALRLDTKKKYHAGIAANRGNIYLDKKNWVMARRAFNQSMKIAEESSNSLIQGSAYANLAFLELQVGNFSEALSQAYMAEDILKNSRGCLNNLIYTYETLTQVYTKMGQYKNALDAIQKLQEYKNQKTSKDVMLAKTKFEIQLNVKSIEDQRKSTSIALVNAQKQLNQRNYDILLILVAFAFMTGAIVASYRKRLLAKQLESERLNTEIKLQTTRFEAVKFEYESKLMLDVAEELHDNILSAISGARLMSENIEMAIAETKNEALIAAHKAEHKVLKTTYRELRNYVNSLRLKNHSGISSNILLELTDYIRETLAIHGIKAQIETRLDKELNELPENFQHALIRIIREALNNISKHSQASTVFVKLRWKQDAFMLSLFDNGIGMNNVNLYNGRGLSNIKKMTERVQGILNVVSKPGEGTLVDLEFRL